MARVVIDPELRGRVTADVLARMLGAGLHVHRVGRAAYVHDEQRRHRWVLVVTPAPDLEARHAAHHRYLIGRGEATGLESRREAAWSQARRRLRLRAPDGRFAGRVPWWAATDPSGRLLTPRSEQPWRLG